ncbi:MAG: ATP-binding cassette domain-containing protein [Methylophilaceae bacterium]|uniref:ATP-binding cassette domain-containing protein n=1 Tax=Methylibium sp. TaxID=2067992 RepID=UPI0035963B12
MMTGTDRVALLKTNSFFVNAPEFLLTQIAIMAREESFKRGAFIYAKNDPAENFYVLLEGKVGHPEVQAAESQYSVATETDHPGQLFGFAALVQGMPRRVISARCERDSRVLVISGRVVQELASEQGREGHELLQTLTRSFAAHERGIASRSGWVSIRNAGKVYDPLGRSVVAVDDCSIEIRPGEFCAIVGPSGCGKSTLLNAIAGFDELTSGGITLDGEWINRPGDHPRPGPDRIVVFQNGALFPWATIRENLVRGPVAQGRMNEEQALEQARTMLRKVGLAEIEDLYPGAISSGMCRRVEIIRALLNDPRVILLDEPFRGLDALTKTVTHEALLELYDLSRKTILFITHDLEEAIYLADRVLVMTTRPGRIKQTIAVNLPRPRSHHLLTSPEFLRLKEEAIEAVHDEAVKAFAAGERELA